MVQIYDRKSKRYKKEKDDPYVNLAIRLGAFPLLPSAIHRFVAKKITHRCKNMFEKKEDAQKRIKDFVKTYHIKTNEAQYPVTHYKTLQEYFQRKLKPKFHHISSPNNNKVLVSPADCRMLVYPHISLVKAIWVKGSKFTLAELLKSPTRAKKYKDCALVLCRLAPQDYHRFHFPMSGKYTNTKHISGHYYSVKPSLIKSNYNVFTENKRTVTYLQTQYFKDIAIITVGATCVGSIVITAKSNSKVKKGQEYGRFAFGGSSVIMLIPKGLINFDKDLMKQSKKGVETLVRMGQRIGTH